MPFTAEQVSIAVKRLVPGATLPRYQSQGAAGMDLHAALEGPLTIEPGEVRLVPTGIAIAVPEGYEAQVRPRSGLATRHAISIPNAPGTIDSDYRGPVMVALVNLGRTPFIIDPDMRVAQLVIAPVARAVLRETDELDTTARGPGGFGSTGR